MSESAKFAFDLQYQMHNGEISALKLHPGEMLFVLGANGTGKSSLMQHFTQNNIHITRKISAHRQTWMTTNALSMTSASKLETQQHIQTSYQLPESRYRDDFGKQRTRITLYELVDAENVRAREITAFVDRGEIEAADNASKIEAPIALINELLLQSNIPISIRIREDECLMAAKNSGTEYSVAELSDGERNAVLIAGEVLTAPNGTLLAIDEPERHLHRSIISPLLKNLFSLRPDCGFVVSTHDHDLPLDVPGSRILLLRSCEFNESGVKNWDADELSACASLDDAVKRDLLGSRRKILFVEGAEHSLDKSLYSLILPMVSVVPKGGCADVERAVEGARGAEFFHWLRAFGIVDNDGFSPEQIKTKMDKGIYSVPFYSIEAIYFHPEIMKRIAKSQADTTDDDAAKIYKRALDAGIDAVKGHIERLSRKAVKKMVRKLVIEQIPNDDDLLDGRQVTIQNDANSILLNRKNELDSAVSNGDWETILTKCSVRESGALKKLLQN